MKEFWGYILKPQHVKIFFIFLICVLSFWDLFEISPALKTALKRPFQNSFFVLMEQTHWNINNLVHL